MPIRVGIWANHKIKTIRRKSQLSIKDLSSNVGKEIREDEDALKNINVWNDGLSSLEKMPSYALYTRLFSLWHVFHLPIFFMMIIAAIVHIFVVYIY